MSQPRTNLINHVSLKGYEHMEIIVHTGANIPLVKNSVPNSYVTGQSKYSLNAQNSVEKPNATISIQGQFPVWNDVLFVETIEKNVQTEELILLILDETLNIYLAEFRAPWIWFEPFYQYHLELNLDNKNTRNTDPIKLYVSITRKQYVLSQVDFKYYGLELLMTHFDTPLSQKTSLYSVCRIVPNYQAYRNSVLKSMKSSVEFRSINFPTPKRSLFQPEPYGIEGYPQVSLSSKPNTIPVWNHNFCFSSNEEKDSMFNENGDPAVIVEFYKFKKFDGRTWSISGLLGWVKIKLDKRCRRYLEDDRNGNGLKTEDMLVETDGSLVGVSSKNLTAEAVLRLLSESDPKNKLNLINTSTTPVLNSYYTKENLEKNIEPVYLQNKVFKDPPKQETKIVNDQPVNNNNNNQDFNNDNNNPNLIRINNTNPQNPEQFTTRNQYNINRYYYDDNYDRFNNQNNYFRNGVASKSYNTFQEPVADFQTNYLRPRNQQIDYFTPRYRESVPLPSLPAPPTLPRNFTIYDDFSDIPPDYRYAFLNYKQPINNDVEGYVTYYQNLINAYKSLVKKMNEDIVLYREQIRNLELSNAQLTSKINNFQDKKYALLKLAEVNELDKTQLNQSFLDLKTRIAVKTNENIILRDQVERLKRELEKKNHLDIELRRILAEKETQHNEFLLVKQRLSKAYGLEDTVKRQEIVIEKLEKFIHKLIKERRPISKNSEFTRIRDEIDGIKYSDFDL